MCEQHKTLILDPDDSLHNSGDLNREGSDATVSNHTRRAYPCEDALIIPAVLFNWFIF